MPVPTGVSPTPVSGSNTMITPLMLNASWNVQKKGTVSGTADENWNDVSSPSIGTSKTTPTFGSLLPVPLVAVCEPPFHRMSTPSWGATRTVSTCVPRLWSASKTKLLARNVSTTAFTVTGTEDTGATGACVAQ